MTKKYFIVKMMNSYGDTESLDKFDDKQEAQDYAKYIRRVYPQAIVEVNEIKEEV